ncbi:MAG: 16S rRNA (guanine(527)-N(7))-methyltransferase RsmG [Syntrophomonas sp.]
MEYNVNRYKGLLLEENTRQNLVSRRTIDQELDKHIEDSTIILNYFSLTGNKILDIGSGAGFPGLILAIYCSEAEFTLLESDQKKSGFLENAIKELNLQNVRVVRQRAEEMGHIEKFRACFDICTSRAVASMNILLEYGLPLLKVGGRLMLWKGRDYQEEIERAKQALEVLGGKVNEIIPYNLMCERDRAIVVVEKSEATPEKYPRRVGIPNKRPL